MPARRRIAVTGLGLVSPTGIGARAFRDALLSGVGGVHFFRGFDASALPVRYGGEIEEFDARQFVEKKDRKSLKIMPRTAQLAVAAGRLAVAEAGLKAGEFDPERLGVMMGTGVIPGDLADMGPAGRLSLDPEGRHTDLVKWGRDGLATIPPMWMLHHVPNMPACHIAILEDARGPNNTLTQYDAAALFALGEACRTIDRDAADVMLAGGTDTRTNVSSVSRGLVYGVLSQHPRPERACRPFDRDRDGQVVAEGAGVLVLEELGHAERRGAKILGEVVGFGSAFDRGKTGKGIARAVRAALAEAGIGPDDLDHVNAAASGSVEDDVWEARGLAEALGPSVPVVAYKSHFGNAGNGASALELAASLIALAEGTLPGTLNHDRSYPDCPIQVVREPRPVTRPHALKVALTDQGQCAAVVVRGAGR